MIKKMLLGLCCSTMLWGENLEDFFKEVSDFTTKTNINIVHQPSALTVLYSQDLKRLGVQTLHEALDFVTGIETSTTIWGAKRAIVRGVNEPYDFVFEKTKFFINGKDVGFEYYSSFPVDLIERIEILRGGSSANYGQGAFNGAINIVTNSFNDSLENSLSLGSGSFNREYLSTYLNTRVGNWKVGVDGYYLKDDKKVDALDATTTISPLFPTTFDREKESLEGKSDSSFGFSAKSKKVTISSRYLNTKYQNHYGFAGLLDFNDEGYSHFTTFASNIIYEESLSDTLTLEAELSHHKAWYKMNTFLYKLEPNSFGIKNPHFAVNFEEEKLEGKLLFKLKQNENNRVHFGVSLGENKTKKNYFYTNADQISQIGIPDPFGTGAYLPISDTLTKLKGERGFINRPDEDTFKSFYFQDLYNYSNNLDLSLNLRYDDYKLYGKEYSFRSAGVYSEDSKNFYKVMLSRSYHFPSYLESYQVEHFADSSTGNPNLEPEFIDSLELAYIYNTMKEKFKLNGYYSVHKNSINIHFGGDNNYHNSDFDQKSLGAELEYTLALQDNSQLFFTLSYAQFMYKNILFPQLEEANPLDPHALKRGSIITHNTPNASRWNSNLAYIYPITNRVFIGNLLKYYGKKSVNNTEDIPSYILWDTSIEYEFLEDLKGSFTVKNILDKKYYYPSTDFHTGSFQREGRNFYLNVNYIF